jgi:hypothetical protein
MRKEKYLFLGIFTALMYGCITNSANINSNIDFNSNNQGLTIYAKDRNVKLFIPSRSLKAVKERQGGGQSNPNYFYFVDTNVAGIDMDLHFSGWLLPIENYKYKDVREFWASEYSQKNILNPKFLKIDEWELFLYDEPLPPQFSDACSSHLRGNLLKGDTWIDLHLSITDRRSSDILHETLIEYLKVIQLMVN